MPVSRKFLFDTEKILVFQIVVNGFVRTLQRVGFYDDSSPLSDEMLDQNSD
jgi:hypothetical protein